MLLFVIPFAPCRHTLAVGEAAAVESAVEKSPKSSHSAAKTIKFRELSEHLLTKGRRGDILKLPRETGGSPRTPKKP